ncbi:peptidoglycan DD-metalloendopeptidase family protein [bacterium]|nr:peptidoglycan DD-metalloendopeptidase family protein [bacterium]
MNRLSSLLLSGVLALGLTGEVSAQNKKKLLEQKSKIQSEIELANRILKETRANVQTNSGQVEALAQKIDLRERLVATMEREIDLLEGEIEESQKAISEREKILELRKAEYADMIQHAERSRSPDTRLLFLLSAESFAQAYRRMEYMKELSRARKRQIELIETERKALETNKRQLEEQVALKQRLRNQRGKELAALELDRAQSEKALQQLTQKEKELQRQISEKKAQQQKLEKEIQKAIAAEIRKAKAAAERKEIEDHALASGLKKGKDFSAKTSNAQLEKLIAARLKKAETGTVAPTPAKPAEKPASNVMALTPEGKIVAAGFSKNKGALPWPVERGLVVSNFGSHPHPIAKNVVVNNNGIDIATESGIDAKSVYEGEAIVIQVPYGNKAVLIKHGNFFTVYDNLAEVYVKNGDKVKARQAIGKVFTDPADGSTRLHFEVWENDKVQNPVPWLSKK